MNFSVEKFDILIARAEDAAAGFDGKALGQAMKALNAYMEVVVAQPPQDAQLLSHMRERLERYQGLCSFLQKTLHGVLLGALGGSTMPCYSRSSDRVAPCPSPTLHSAKQHHLAPLIRRYC